MQLTGCSRTNLLSDERGSDAPMARKETWEAKSSESSLASELRMDVRAYIIDVYGEFANRLKRGQLSKQLM